MSLKKILSIFVLLFALSGVARATNPPLFAVNGKYLGWAGTGGGTANAQTVTYSPATTAYTIGQVVAWLPLHANTTSTPTLTVDSNAAVTVVGFNGMALLAGDLSTTNAAQVIYDGTNFELLDPQVSMVMASAIGTTKQICSVTGTVCSWIDFSERYDVPAANCNNASAGAGWSIGSGGTVSCRAGTNNLGGYILITDTSNTFATFQIAIPKDWDTSVDPYIRVQLSTSDTVIHTIIPSIQVACYAGDGTTTDDVAPNAAHSLSTITTNSTNGQFWTTSNVQMNSTDMTGCIAGSLMQITIGRATDTSATGAKFYSATVTFPRLLTVGAE